MEAGEKELREAFEENITNNVKRVVEHTNETRKMLRSAEEKIERLEKHVISLNQTIEQLRAQLAAVQAIVFRGGTI